MLSNKLVSLLKSLSKIDLNRFDKYLKSPFFNENTEQITLFEILNRYLRHPDLDSMELKKQEVWQKLFKTTPYNDITFRRICSDLTQNVLNYLSFKEYKNQPLLVESNM